MTKIKAKSEIELLAEINEKLDQLISLNIIQGKEKEEQIRILVSRNYSKEEQIRILVSRNYSNSNIASLLGIPKGTVDRIRANLKK